MQTNSPFSMPKVASSNTVRAPPCPSGNLWVRCSIERNGLDTMGLPSLFRVGDGALQRGKGRVQHHADDTDHEDREDDRGQVEVVPLVPDVIADPRPADEHL